MTNTPGKEHPMTSNRVIDPELERIADEISASNRPVSEMVYPFDETVTHELEIALDNYADDPHDNGALNRLANNCVTIGYEFALRATPQPLSDDVVERVARALCEDSGEDPDDPDACRICDKDNQPLPLWTAFEEAARAAIAAIPSAGGVEEMREALERVRNGLRAYLPCSAVMSPVSHEKLIQIIDAALGKGER